MTDVSTILFIAEDSTSYRVLEPVAFEISNSPEIEVEFLILDGLFDSRHENRSIGIDRGSITFDAHDVRSYVDCLWLGRFPQTIPESIIQRILLDHVSPSFAYNLEDLFRQVDPDLIVSAVDQIPFLRQLIHEADERGVPTATLQHGTYEFALSPEYIEEKPFFPDFSPRSKLIESFKRQSGFKYGITEYCHPDTDLVMTLGEFFTERIRWLRSQYPYHSHTMLVETGSPEFTGPVKPYQGNAESVLFLSQQQYERGAWDRRTQERLISLLENIDRRVPVSVRPHPKGSEKKAEWFAERLDLTNQNSLRADIESHDIILTVNSTAIYEGVIQGKSCGILQIKDQKSDFEPFTHEHLVQVRDGMVDFSNAARARSEATQRDYLRQFCYLPGFSSECGSSSTAVIADKLLALVEDADR